MKFKRIFFVYTHFFLFSALYCFDHTKNCAVIPTFSGGRFGDNLLAMAHVIYFALKNQSEPLLIPFEYSDQLMMDVILQKYSPEIKSKFKHRATFSGGNVFMGGRENTLYTVPFFPDASDIESRTNSRNKPAFAVYWDDPDFKAQLQRLYAPKNPLRLIEQPKDRISVAVHVRKGGNWGDENAISSNPHILKQKGILIYKIPLDEFYIAQIQKAYELCNGAPLYVFLFTDHLDTDALIRKYVAAIDNPMIEISCRKNEPTDYCYNVLEDFFSMMNFDILIRSQSSFSLMVEKLGKNKVVISAGDTFIPGTYIQEGLIDIKDQNFKIKV